MRDKTAQRKKLLTFLLESRESASKLRNRTLTRSRLLRAAAYVLIIGPLLYFRDLGSIKYAVAFSSGIGGALIGWSTSVDSTIARYEWLHKFIDFDKVKVELDKGAT
jgi:hypothetical protein